MGHNDTVLEMRGISKHFHRNRVLNDIHLSVRRGEIHAILGENGAGKSTLMNILFGMPVIHSTGGYEGEIFLDGDKIAASSPMEAMGLGIGMVHQEFMLIPAFSITENIKLNREITRANPVSRILGRKLETLDRPAMGADARTALGRLNLGIDEWAPVAGLPVGHKQFVEIAREIDKRNVKLMVFDEPTAVLTENEASRLLEAMRNIAASGIGILFITHRLDEVMEVADTITVLRDGNLVGRKDRTQTSVYELAELMVGRKIERLARDEGRAERSGEIALALRDFRVHMPGEEVRGVDLDVYEGEILGIGGLAGQGKVGIANGVVGLFPAEGTLMIRGEKIPLNDPRETLRRNVAFVSEDRRGAGLLLDLSIELNAVIPAIQNKGRYVRKLGFLGYLDHGAIRRNAMEMIRLLDIRCTGPAQTVRRLSGGNQQKVCLAKALTYEAATLFVSEPTRGIDIGAKRLILDTLVRMNQEQGVTIVMTSSELAELKSVCDRIAIIDEGRIAGILKPTDSDVDFGLLMGGERKQAAETEGP